MYSQYMGGENDLRIDGAVSIIGIYSVSMEKLYKDVKRKMNGTLRREASSR